MKGYIKEIIIFLIAVLITFGFAFGIIKLIRHNKPGSTEIKKDKTPPLLNIEWEKKLKDLIKKEIEADNKIIKNEILTNAVYTITNRVNANIKDNPYEIEIIIVNSPVINAAALPGGLLIIFSGLLNISDSPEEIAAVIAHELGHITNRDSVNMLLREFGLALLVSVLSGDSNITQRIIKELISNKFSRDMEKNADIFACDLLAKSDINPKHLAGIFKKMKEKEKILVDKSLLKYISTHPDTDERITYAEKAAESFKGQGKKIELNWKAVKKIFRQYLING